MAEPVKFMYNKNEHIRKRKNIAPKYEQAMHCTVMHSGPNVVKL